MPIDKDPSLGVEEIFLWNDLGGIFRSQANTLGIASSEHLLLGTLALSGRFYRNWQLLLTGHMASDNELFSEFGIVISHPDALKKNTIIHRRQPTL